MYLATSFDPVETKFEKRCYNEFWLNHLDILEQLRNDKPELSYIAKHKEMIVGFVEFVKKWEIKAKKMKIKLYKISDNIAFDVHFINVLIHEHYGSQMLPFPYEFSTQQYAPLWKTTSCIKGFFLSIDPNNTVLKTKDMGFSTALQKFYPNLPKCHVSANHLPHHDAHTIAHTFVLLLDIASRKHSSTIK